MAMPIECRPDELRRSLHGAKAVLAGVLAATLAYALPAAAADGESIYRATCSSCHDSGAGQAPRTGNGAEWAGRFGAGREALQRAAIAGVPNTAMAPKGGFAQLSDAEVRAAVDYMLARTGFAEPAVLKPAHRASAPQQSAAAGAAPDDVVLAARTASALRSALAGPNAPIEAEGAELVVRGVGIRVRAQDGSVRLMGVVQDSDVAKRAEAIVRKLDGVRDVDNRLVSGGMLDFD